MTTYGYARAADGQTLDAELEALKAAGCERIFRDEASGVRGARAELAQLLSTIEAGDVLIVSRLDRLDRRRATFRSLGDQCADTTTPQGRLIRTVLGGLAEFERQLVRVRTGEGRRTRKGARAAHGPAPRLTMHQQAEARKALAEGSASQADLARRFGVSQSTISRLADKAAAAPALSRRAIDAETERAARAFLGRLEGKYPVIEGILYGSRARGDFAPGSDADIAVVLVFRT